MAIYHCSLRAFSRSDNHSAVAAAAYRSGRNLKDERTGQSHHYRNRKGILDAFILLPLNAPEAYADRPTLWNAAESAETRKNARVAREVILALPHELSDTQRISLARDMALYLVETYTVPVDVAIHLPVEGDGHDPRNHHAHLLFSTRELTPEGFGKKTRILDDKEDGPKQVELIRDVWEALANAALGAAGFEARIDKRSLEDQGVDRIPQNHVGKVATHSDDEDEEETPRKRDEEEEEGDKGKQGKTGSGDTQTPAPSTKEAAPAKNEQKPPKEQKQLRLALNDEIKELNLQRVAFSPIPLKDQIKQLDRLMDRLDGRIQRLKTLSEKTSLPERLSKAITSLFFKAKEALVVRTKDEAQRAFSAADRARQAERQQARYSRTYRASIKERIVEMRENIQVLETKQKQFQRYKAFVELIERRVEVVRSDLKPPALPIKTEWKITTAQFVSAKILLEATQARDKVPIEYRPTIKHESLSKSFTNVLKATTSPLAVSVATAPRSEKSFGAPPPREVKKNPIQENTNQKTSLGIEKDKPPVWRVETSERGKEILTRWREDITERKAASAILNPTGYSGKFNHPTRIVTEDQVIQKVRSEAIFARAKVPTEFRAYPYPQAKTSSPNNGLGNAWDKATQVTPLKETKKFSAKFNEASGNVAEKKPPDPNLDKHI